MDDVVFTSHSVAEVVDVVGADVPVGAELEVVEVVGAGVLVEESAGIEVV